MSQAPLPFEPPPTEDELPYEDGVPVESTKHALQRDLCARPLSRHLGTAGDYYIGTDQALYYSLLQARRTDFRAPDFMIMLDVERRLRKSWLVWQEDGRVPDVIIELLSASTAAMDKGEKLRAYEQLVRVPEYFLFDPDSGELLGYRLGLSAGRVAYQPIAQNAAGRLPCERLGLDLGLWEGDYEGYRTFWLRWFTKEGTLLPTSQEAEAAEQAARQQAEAARQQAETRAEAAEAEIAHLRALLAQKS